VAVLSGGGSGQVDPPGGSPVPPPPPHDIFTPVFRPTWIPRSPVRALIEKMRSAKISYVFGDDLAGAAAAAKSADVAIGGWAALARLEAGTRSLGAIVPPSPFGASIT